MVYSDLEIKWPVEVEFILAFLKDLRDNVSRPERLADILKEKAENKKRSLEHEIKELKKSHLFNENNPYYKDMLDEIRKSNNAIQNLKQEKYLKYVRRKEKEMESKDYFFIADAENIQKRCLECSKIIQNADWDSFNIIFNNLKPRIQQSLIDFFQRIYTRIDAEKGRIHYKLESYFENTIRNFLYLFVAHAKVFKQHKQEKKKSINLRNILEQMASNERLDLIFPYININRYVSDLNEKQLYEIINSLFKKLEKQEKNSLLKKEIKNINLTSFMIMNLVQNLSQEDKQLLFREIQKFLPQKYK
ncbi:MAG: hypothetical protein ACFFAS_06940 [Promethearchaeota archaeon]